MAAATLDLQVACSNTRIAHGTKYNAETMDISGANDEGGAKAWVVVGAASAVMFVGIGYTNTYGVFQEYYQQHLFPDIPQDKTILIGSIAASLYFLLGSLTGRFADLVGYRAALILGSALMIGKKLLYATPIGHGHT